MFRQKTLLITGGTGSFGTVTLERFLKTDIKEIRIFSRDEKKQNDMRLQFKDDRVKFYLGDVRNYDSIDFALKGVDYVFHAAALKQVPSCEFYPMEAVNTNILGTQNVLKAATLNNIQRVVVLSTDKAVYPINVMGISKAMLEKLMVARSRTVIDNSIVFCGTRYGNVMCSRGSVIPLFVEQIKTGKPITITDPRMTRFLLTLDGAIGLVLFAFEKAKQGDMFVQKAPACSVGDLATALKELFKSKVETKIIGTRHGEKLHETLLTREELSRAEDMGHYYRVPSDTRDLNYEKYFSEGEDKISTVSDYTSENTTQLSLQEVKDMLLGLNFIRSELQNWKR